MVRLKGFEGIVYESLEWFDRSYRFVFIFLYICEIIN